MNVTSTTSDFVGKASKILSATAASILENVGLDYTLGKTKITAVSDLTMRVERGEFGVVMGPSGSGKTSLLNLLGCIDQPTSGTVRTLGVDTTTLNDRALTKLRRDKIGFIFQNFSLIPVLTAAENVEYPLILEKVPVNERKARVAEALASVGLEKRASHRPGELSGGQRQRVAIARALIKRPELVLADEPTANVDSKTAETIMQLIRRIQEESGTTFFVATHDARVLAYATKRWTMSDGAVTETEV